MAIRVLQLAAYLSGATPIEGESNAPDPLMFVMAVLLSILTVALAIALGAFFRSAWSDAKAIHAAPQPKILAPPVTPTLPKVAFEPDDSFRILQDAPDAEEYDDNFGYINILSDPEPATLPSPKCFVCGRPMNEGEHSHFS